MDIASFIRFTMPYQSGGIHSARSVPLRHMVTHCIPKRFSDAFRPGVKASALLDGQIYYQELSRAEPVYLVSSQEMVSPVTNLLSSTPRSVLFLGRSMG